ncbi:MAG: hypothetical protein LBQ54_01530 [Planctomycetaceae bacterium]|jgi:hypothetical protein|nr:hypothetical protein [Planctomycetaceae bacterium]
MESSTFAVCRSLPKIEELGDGTYHISLWSETEPEIRLWAVRGLRFHEKFRVFWVENLSATEKPCSRMQPVDWFFLRHLCRHGSSTVQSILDALTEDPDFPGEDGEDACTPERVEVQGISRKRDEE